MKFYDEKKFTKIRNILIVSALTLLTILLFFKVYEYFVKPINLVISTIFPFILSFIIVYALMPIIDMISVSDDEKKQKKMIRKVDGKIKLNRNLAILVVLTMFFAIFLYIVLTIIPLVTKQLSGLIEFFIKNQDQFQKNTFKFLEDNNIDLKTTILNSKDAIISNLLKVLSSSFSLISSTFTLLFMTPIFTIMLIFSYDSIEKGVKNKLDALDLSKEKNLIKEIDKSIGDYIKVTIIDSLIVGVLSYIIFYFVKLDYSLLFSMIIGFGNVIPFLGPFIGLVPVVLFAITKSWQLALWIVVFITIIQTIEANIIKPWLTSKSVNIHPITTLLVVLIGGALFGMGGAFIAIPVYVIIKKVLEFYFPVLKIGAKIEEE